MYTACAVCPCYDCVNHANPRYPCTCRVSSKISQKSHSANLYIDALKRGSVYQTTGLVESAQRKNATAGPTPIPVHSTARHPVQHPSQGAQYSIVEQVLKFLSNMLELILDAGWHHVDMFVDVAHAIAAIVNDFRVVGLATTVPSEQVCGVGWYI